MSSWDSEGFEPNVGKPGKTNNWVDEDKDNKTKDNWEDEDASGDEDGENDELKEVLEQTKKKQMEVEKKRSTDDKDEKDITADNKTEQKPEAASTQENEDKPEGKGQIDLFEPTNKEQFDKFNEMLKLKVTGFEKSQFYVQFLDSLFRDTCNNMEADDVKKILSTINAVSNEKMKQQKTTKGKKKSKKATLAVGKDIEKDEMDEVEYDDFDDYI